MADRDTNFSAGTIIGSAWLNLQQDIDAGAFWNIKLEIASPTVLRVPVPTSVSDGFPALRINGKSRINTAAVTLDLTGTPSGTRDIYAVDGGGPGFTLAHVASGGAAPSAPASRKIGEASWNGSLLTAPPTLALGYGPVLAALDAANKATLVLHNQLVATVEDLIELVGSRGYNYVHAPEQRNNGTYGVLATPDRISDVDIPPGAKLRVTYHALWRATSTASGSVLAAVFVNGDQVSQPAVVTPLADDASFNPALTDDTFAVLQTSPIGMVTGQPVAVDITESSTAAILATGPGSAGWEGGGAMEVMYLPAGNTVGAVVEVRFRTTGVPVEVKQRHLWVEVVPHHSI